MPSALSATYTLFPSGLTAIPSGAPPAAIGARGTSAPSDATLYCEMSLPARSVAYTDITGVSEPAPIRAILPVFTSANQRFPSGPAAMAPGALLAAAWNSVI